MKIYIFGVCILSLIRVNINCLAHISTNNEPFEGYNLYSTLRQGTTYIMDNNGNTLHTWKYDKLIAESVYLLENGELLSGCHLKFDLPVAAATIPDALPPITKTSIFSISFTGSYLTNEVKKCNCE
jgi:hypothetical protein